MIEGMEILSKAEIMEKRFPEWLLLTMVITALLCIFGCEILSVVYKDVFFLGAGAFLAIVLCGFYCSLANFFLKETPTGRYRYEVSISDEISFNEVHERYEVVEVKDGTYILEGRESVEDICNECSFTLNEKDKFCPECGTKR